MKFIFIFFFGFACSEFLLVQKDFNSALQIYYNAIQSAKAYIKETAKPINSVPVGLYESTELQFQKFKIVFANQ